MTWHEAHAEDVAAASAAYAWNVLGEIAKLPPTEGYQRLHDLFFTALLAFAEGRSGWVLVPEPSEN